MAVDIEGLVEKANDAPGEGRGLVGAPHRRLHDDEFVPAEAGDEVGVAHDRAQAIGHRAEQLVALRMAKRVVHLLELVEVDEQDGAALALLMRLHEHAHDLLAEIGAVRQLGERVVTREVPDRGFRRAPLGHILDEDDRTAAFHRLESEGQGAAVLGGRGERRLDAPRQAFLETRGEPAHVGFRHALGARRFVEQRLDRGATMRSVGRGSEETLDAVVRHHEALVRVEHHEAERHVVEGGVETVGEQGHVTRRDQRIEERAPQPRRDRFDAQEERQDDDDEDEPIGRPGHHQRE